MAALAGDRTARDLERRFGGIHDDPSAIHRMQRIADRLGIEEVATHHAIALRFELLATNHLGAYSLPDGRVYITCGLYDKLHTDDSLAAVLAHEAAHIRTQDGDHPLRSERDGLAREMAADRYAIERLVKAEYQPASMIEVLEITRAEQKPGCCEKRIFSLRSLLAD
ncbi:MAG: M48 family metalloprotease [Planctomycetota bacterium]